VGLESFGIVQMVEECKSLGTNDLGSWERFSRIPLPGSRRRRNEQ
jgi:hypothetical protein